MAAEETTETVKPMFQFRVLERAAASTTLGPRLGHLSRKGRNDILTPNYLAITSRGVVPHLSQDTLRSRTDVKGVYVALEDCKHAQSHRPRFLTCNIPHIKRGADGRISD